MSFNLIITPAFEREAKTLMKKYKSFKNDLAELFESLEKEPIQGIRLGKGCFKIRLAIADKGKGKSSGARVITCVNVTTENIFLLTIYDKSERESISDKELRQLLGYL